MEKIFINQTAIISGGIGDIGYATAIEFARLGANIALGDIRKREEAIPFLKGLEELGVKAIYHTVDVSDATAVSNWVSGVEQELGVASLIIANAATVTRARIHELTPEQWSRELRVNLDGAFYLTQAATARMVEKKIAGRVVFVGSWAGTKVHPHIPAYSVSKAGVTMLCKCLALELAPHQILVNEIAPGYVAAGLSGRIWKELPGQEEKSKQEVPILKLITAGEVAEQIVFLCHPVNQQMTGSVLLMDGGLSLK